MATTAAPAASVLMVGLATLAGGCSFALVDPDFCDNDADCASFAAGAVCDDGICGVPGDYIDPCAEVIGGGEGELVSLGAILPMTKNFGAEDRRGVTRRDAMMLALEEINARSGVTAVRFELRVCDSGGDRDQVRGHAARLLDGGAVALVTTGSDDTLAAFGEAKSRGALVMSVSGTSPELTGLLDDGLVWRTAPSDAIQGAVLAEIVAARSVARVAVFEVDTVYGNGLRKVFTDSYEGDTEVYLFKEGGNGLEARLGDADEYDPDVTVIISGPTDAATAVQGAMSREQLAESAVFLSDSAKNDTFLDALTPAARKFLQASTEEGAPVHVGTAPAVAQSDAFSTFASRYEQWYGSDPATLSFVAHSYDAIYALALAIVWARGQDGAGRLDGGAIAEGLGKLSSSDAAMSLEAANFSDLHAALSSGESVNIDGASGSLDFDAATGDVTGPVEVWRLTSDGFATVRVVTPSSP